MKKLIAYYSRAGENYFSGTHRAIAVGNTEKAARLLAELTGAELFHIEQKVPYSDDYDTCVAGSRPVCPCAAARWTAQNRNWSSGCAGNVCVLTGREEGGCA